MNGNTTKHFTFCMGHEDEVRCATLYIIVALYCTEVHIILCTVDISCRLTVTVLAVRAGVLLSFPG